MVRLCLRVLFAKLGYRGVIHKTCEREVDYTSGLTLLSFIMFIAAHIFSFMMMIRGQLGRLTIFAFRCSMFTFNFTVILNFALKTQQKRLHAPQFLKTMKFTEKVQWVHLSF